MTVKAGESGLYCAEDSSGNQVRDAIIVAFVIGSVLLLIMGGLMVYQYTYLYRLKPSSEGDERFRAIREVLDVMTKDGALRATYDTPSHIQHGRSSQHSNVMRSSLGSYRPSADTLGNVVFVVTDLMDSTPLSVALPGHYQEMQCNHDDLVRSLVDLHGGQEIGTQGDSFELVFPDVTAAVVFSITLQRRMLEVPWARRVLQHSSCRVELTADKRLLFKGPRIRTGIHAAEAGEYLRKSHETTKTTVYMGQAMDFARNLADSAHGGQVIMSDSTWDKLRTCLQEASYPVVESLGVYQFSQDSAAFPSAPRPFCVYQLHPPMGSAMPRRHFGSELRGCLRLSQGVRMNVIEPPSVGAQSVSIVMLRFCVPYPSSTLKTKQRQETKLSEVTGDNIPESIHDEMRVILTSLAQIFSGHLTWHRNGDAIFIVLFREPQRAVRFAMAAQVAIMFGNWRLADVKHVSGRYEEKMGEVIFQGSRFALAVHTSPLVKSEKIHLEEDFLNEFGASPKKRRWTLDLLRNSYGSVASTHHSSSHSKGTPPFSAAGPFAHLISTLRAPTNPSSNFRSGGFPATPAADLGNVSSQPVGKFPHDISSPAVPKFLPVNENFTKRGESALDTITDIEAPAPDAEDSGAKGQNFLGDFQKLPVQRVYVNSEENVQQEIADLSQMHATIKSNLKRALSTQPSKRRLLENTAEEPEPHALVENSLHRIPMSRLVSLPPRTQPSETNQKLTHDVRTLLKHDRQKLFSKQSVGMKTTNSNVDLTRLAKGPDYQSFIQNGTSTTTTTRMSLDDIPVRQLQNIQATRSLILPVQVNEVRESPKKTMFDSRMNQLGTKKCSIGANLGDHESLENITLKEMMEVRPVDTYDAWQMEYMGTGVDECLDLVLAAYGGQTIVSEATWQATHSNIPPNTNVVFLGKHRLTRDSSSAQTVMELSCQRLKLREFPVLHAEETFEPGYRSAPLPEDGVAIMFTKVAPVQDLPSYVLQDSIALFAGLLRMLLGPFDGHECKEPDPGKFTLAFHSVHQALVFAATLQSQLLSLPWPEELLLFPECQSVISDSGKLIQLGLPVSMGCAYRQGSQNCFRKALKPTGRPDYFGSLPNLAARVLGQAHPMQVLVEGALHVREDKLQIDSKLKGSNQEMCVNVDGYRLVCKPCGYVELKGIQEQQWLYSVSLENLAERVFPPLKGSIRDSIRQQKKSSFSKHLSLESKPKDIQDKKSEKNGITRQAVSDNSLTLFFKSTSVTGMLADIRNTKSAEKVKNNSFGDSQKNLRLKATSSFEC